MSHWHRLEVWARDFTDYFGEDVSVYLGPPRLRYESLREEIQESLDHAFRYGKPSRYARDQAHAWRAGTEVPPDTLFVYDKVLVILGCDNECPREAQIVLDELCDSMGRKAPRVTRHHAANRPDDPWPKDFLELFDDPEPPPYRPARRRR